MQSNVRLSRHPQETQRPPRMTRRRAFSELAQIAVLDFPSNTSTKVQKGRQALKKKRTHGSGGPPRLVKPHQPQGYYPAKFAYFMGTWVPIPLPKTQGTMTSIVHCRGRRAWQNYDYKPRPVVSAFVMDAHWSFTFGTGTLAILFPDGLQYTFNSLTESTWNNLELVPNTVLTDEASAHVSLEWFNLRATRSSLGMWTTKTNPGPPGSIGVIKSSS